MALITCKECAGVMSTEALACVHCGAPNHRGPAVMTSGSEPAVVSKSRGVFVGWTIALGLIGVMALKLIFWTDKPDPVAEAAHIRESEQACRADLECWSAKVAPTQLCKQPIESLAKFSMRWVDEKSGPSFSHLRWIDKEAGVVSYIGDNAEFQNMYGAYQRMTFQCDVMPSERRFVDVRAYPGRIGQ